MLKCGLTDFPQPSGSRVSTGWLGTCVLKWEKYWYLKEFRLQNFMSILSYSRSLGTAILLEGQCGAFGLKASLHARVLRWGFIGSRPSTATQVTVRSMGGNGTCHPSVSHTSQGLLWPWLLDSTITQMSLRLQFSHLSPLFLGLPVREEGLRKAGILRCMDPKYPGQKSTRPSKLWVFECYDCSVSSRGCDVWEDVGKWMGGEFQGTLCVTQHTGVLCRVFVVIVVVKRME